MPFGPPPPPGPVPCLRVSWIQACPDLCSVPCGRQTTKIENGNQLPTTPAKTGHSLPQEPVGTTLCPDGLLPLPQQDGGPMTASGRMNNLAPAATEENLALGNPGDMFFLLVQTRQTAQSKAEQMPPIGTGGGAPHLTGNKTKRHGIIPSSLQSDRVRLC